VTYSFRIACTTAWVKGDTLGIEAGIVDIGALKEGMDVLSTDRKLMAFLILCVFLELTFTGLGSGRLEACLWCLLARPDLISHQLSRENNNNLVWRQLAFRNG
jgi:hypothetical protein